MSSKSKEKVDKRNRYILGLFGIAIFVMSFFVDVVFIGLIGLLFIIISSLIFGTKGAIYSSLVSTLSVFVSVLFSTQEVYIVNILVSIAAYYILGFIIGKSVDLIKKQKKEVELKNKEIVKYKLEAEKVFEGTNDNMFLVKVIEDDTFEYIRNNNAHQKSTGISLDEIKGKSPIDLLGEKLGNEIIDHYKECINAKKTINYEEILDLPAGEKIWNTSLTPIFEDGRITNIVGSSQDITSRKKAEKELIESKNRLRSIIETTQDGFWIIDENRKFTDVNDAYLKMTGYTRKEILELTINDLEVNESLEETKKRVKYILDKGSLIFETKHKKKNGEIFDVEVSVSCMNKKPIEFLCFCRDITAKKKDKKQIIKIKESLNNIIEGANVGTWEWNPNTDETVFNEKWAEILGYSLKEISPTNINTWEKLTHPDDLKKANEVLKKVMNKEKEYYNIELRMKHKNGKWVWINDRGKVTKWSDDGKPLLLSGTHMDITKRKEAQQEVDSTHKLIKYILRHNTSGVAVHDKEMNYMYVSERYLNRYNIENKDIIGKNHYEVFPDLPNKWKAVHKRALQGEVIKNDEDPYYREDGSVDWTKWEVRPWYESDGNIGGVIVYTEIITEQKQLEAQIYNEREQFKTTLLSVGDAIISTDKQGKIKLMNKVAKELTGWGEEAYDKPLEDVLKIVNEYTRKTTENPAKKALKHGKTVEMENHTILIAKDGKEIPIEDSAAPIKDRDGRVTGAVIVFRDFTEKRQKQKQIEYLSFHDILTGLYNRRYMEDSLRMLDTKRNMPFSIILSDINGLKLTNDAYGHEMGDKLLKTVAKILKESCRKEDIVCRVGGDEFVILLPRISKKETEKIMEKITKKTQRAKLDSVIVSLAVGYSIKNNEEKNILEVYKEADNKMYKNKLKYGRIMRNKTIETVLVNINNKYDHEQIHTQRVSQYCLSIAKAMNLNEKEIEDAKIAGRLHDIGKIIVPPEILNKKEKLDNEELETIKKHPITSYQLLKSVDEYSHLAEAVLYHHERLDATGYPENIEGHKIPLLSKIISVADAYEAMTAKRPYQKIKTKEEAVEELKKYSGTQFDEEIVKIFINKVI